MKFERDYKGSRERGERALQVLWKLEKWQVLRIETLQTAQMDVSVMDIHCGVSKDNLPIIVIMTSRDLQGWSFALFSASPFLPNAKNSSLTCDISHDSFQEILPLRWFHPRLGMIGDARKCFQLVVSPDLFARWNEES
uniref:Uncharacterized protein n=1 Tax=Compsopogon caeruleus TaxID=31354 RepID=A0A6T6BAV8_9RHOD|mmetsp:Transcript_15053/g.30584  ORF Transcript_15053/g.30584 Transcript_15053/m.30584 type:complete len:138 (+) Transcript_15053:214-627(+)|eukprot:CAMPEP_0184685274 /NCGR_PEP_ID=MMETSP0312-20130426/18328_1 /TAXON_ID=31354 /ORGANISM="Compsopogon coeruleus, Strain SAG 36.94" /LENGTH=137 /DNA_ID=CAMNT_0027139197 /DNA_START=198 /DNA_END=614 /DNA_ORIENTATION=+